MKLIPSRHWLVWLAVAIAFCAFLSVSATILQSQIALEAPFFHYNGADGSFLQMV